MLLIEEQALAAKGWMGARAWLAAVLIGLWWSERPPGHFYLLRDVGLVRPRRGPAFLLHSFCTGFPTAGL